MKLEALLVCGAGNTDKSNAVINVKCVGIHYRELPALFATAPDLLEACRLAAEINIYGNLQNKAAKDACLAAIAKAEGKEAV